ncbi:MAG: hypothetical protein H0X46_04010 [Bacteroidetes bacterium]|nr:hypothetical protein [Bacteroidota bacterium]
MKKQTLYLLDKHYIITDEQLNIIDKTELFSATVALRDDGLFQVDMKVINREVSLKDVRELTEAVGMLPY